MDTIDWKNINVAYEAIKHSPGCIYWKDGQGYYKGCNLNVAVLAGESDPKELLNKKDDSLPWRKRAEEIRAVDMYVMQNDKEICFREEMPLPEGGTVIYQTIKRALKVDDKIVGVVGYAVDITAQEAEADFNEDFSKDLKRILNLNKRDT